MGFVSAVGLFVIFGLLLISGVSGLFPVFSGVLALKSLIINTIHFCRFACICRLGLFV